jgi:SAM-dependent methyltransferase
MGSERHAEWISRGEIEFAERGCPICNSDDGQPMHSKTVAGFEMHYWKCRHCTALYARNPATTESLPRIFGSKDFFAAGEPGGDNIDYYDFIGGEKFLRLTARDRIRRIRKYQPAGRLLEVASAAGFFLVEAKAAGYTVEGVEISAPMAKYASERWSVPVVGRSIELMELPPDHYDVIASWGVMTILRDPVAAMDKFCRALKPGGLWAFNTYFYDGLWARLVGPRWNILGVQTSQIFSKKLLLDQVSAHGFELLSRQRDWPHTDLLKIADQLAKNTGWKWVLKVVQKTNTENLIVKIPLPDVYEYIWRKR